MFFKKFCQGYIEFHLPGVVDGVTVDCEPGTETE